METNYAEYSESNNFQMYWSILRRRWLLGTGVFALVFSSVAICALLQQPSYEAIGKILLKRKDTVASLTGLGGESRGELQTLGQTKDPIDTELEVITSDPLIRKTIEGLDLRDKDGKRLTIEDFMNKLSVKSVKGADVLKVSYVDNNAARSAAVVNFLMQSYLQKNLYANRAEAVSARKYIEAQLPTVEKKVRRADAELRKFKEVNKVVSLKEEAQSAISVIAELEKQSTQDQAELGYAVARSNTLRSRLGMSSKDAMTLGSISQSPPVQQALEELQKVQGDIAIQSTRFTEESPTIVSLRRKEEALKTLLKGRVKGLLGKGKQDIGNNLQVGELRIKMTEDLIKSEVDRLGLASRVAILSSRQAAYKQRVSDIPRLEQGERELSQALEVSQATYGLLLKKLQEIQVTENQNIGNARILAEAIVPEKPSGPKTPANLAAGALLGGLFALGTIYILEERDKSIKTVKDAKQLFGYRLLDQIPFSEYKLLPENTLEGSLPSGVKVPALIASPQSPAGGAYRMLQANLRSMHSEKVSKIKTVVISSAVPKEGKSTVAANLAAAIAKVSRKALLIDADMHRPCQHEIWSIPNQIGLSEVIMGQATTEGAIQKVLPFLDVLTAGTQPPSPLALLDSEVMSSFLKQMSEMYDLIILDTPPLVLEADATVLGKMCDGLLLVVRPGVVDSVSSARAKALLEQSGQNVLGQVVNGVIIENEPHSYYSYYSYYQQAGS
ncbi:MAG: polysaccharide biosynthesis tyrosine autokinase [Gloeobacterales cyanobacterium]